MLDSGKKDENFLETGRTSVRGKRGAVTPPHYLATQAGVNIIRKGGHAVEAAIGSNAVLSVVYPHMAGIGGDLFSLVKDKNEDAVNALNGSGKSSESVDIKVYRDKGYDSIPEKDPLAANTVPGTVDAWEKLHEKYERLKWHKLFEEAIYYAREGFPITERLADFILQEQHNIEQFEKTASLFLPDGNPLKGNDILIQHELAETLESISKEGASVFYQGDVGKKMGLE